MYDSGFIMIMTCSGDILRKIALAALTLALVAPIVGSAIASDKESRFKLYDGSMQKKARLVDLNSVEKVGNATVFKIIDTTAGTINSSSSVVVFCGNSIENSYVIPRPEVVRQERSGELKALDFSRKDYRTAIREARFSPTKGFIDDADKLMAQKDAAADEWIKTGNGPYNLLKEKLDLALTINRADVYPHWQLLYKIACVNSFRAGLEKARGI